MKKVLVVEDDSRLREHLCKSILSEGIASMTVQSPEELSTMLESKEDFSSIILDRLVGSIDTRDWLKPIKAKWPNASVIVVSAINTGAERTDLINLGADDYLGKPFLTQELIARLKAAERRISRGQENYRVIGNLVLDLVRRVMSVGESSELLPAKEFLLLKVFTEDPGRVLSRSELLESVWGSSSIAETNVVEATISNLRKRLTDLGASVSIKNMRNAGYWLED